MRLFYFFLLIAAASLAISASYAAVPLQINHQGVVKVNGVPFNGTGQFRFAIVDPDTGLNGWTNDGSALFVQGMPGSSLPIPVNDGLYHVRLGDLAQGSVIPIPAEIFDNDNLVLRVWFDDGANGLMQLEPDHPLTTSPYSFRSLSAETADSSMDGVPAGFAIISETSEPPPGYSFTGLQSKVGDTWVQKTVMPTPRTKLAVGVVDNMIYAIGGQTKFGSPSEQTNVNEAYDPVTNLWETRAPMSGPRSSLSAGVIGGLIYAIGGFVSGVGVLGTNEAYDPVSDTWEPKAPMPTPRTALAVAAADRKIYALGGFDEGINLGVNEEYDPAMNSWETKERMLTSRGGLAAAVVTKPRTIIIGPVKSTPKGLILGPREVVHALGGVALTAANGFEEGYNEEYGPQSNEWFARTNLPIGIRDFTASTLNNLIYVFGLNEKQVDSVRPVPIPVAQVYEHSTETWLPIAPMPTMREHQAAGVVNGKIYLIGGEWRGRILNTNEEYTPVRNMFVHVKD